MGIGPLLLRVISSFRWVTPHERTRAIAGVRVAATWQFYRGKAMISASSVLVMGDSLAQPRKFSGLDFGIVSSLELVFLVILPRRKQGFAFDGLIVQQHVFIITVIQIKSSFVFRSRFGFVGLRCCHAFVIFGGF